MCVWLQYAPSLARTTGNVLLSQLSRVFKSLRLPLLEDLVRPLDIVGDDLERLLISCSRLQRPALQVDRAGGYIVFGSPTVAVRVCACVCVDWHLDCRFVLHQLVVNVASCVHHLLLWLRWELCSSCRALLFGGWLGCMFGHECRCTLTSQLPPPPPSSLTFL